MKVVSAVLANGDQMKATLKLIFTPCLILMVLFATAGTIIPQERSTRQMIADGQGTVEVGREKMDLHSVIVKLMDDGQVEFILVSDITFFLKGTWAENEKAHQEIDVKITGGATGSGVQGNGKIFLRDDGKSISKLALEGASNRSQRRVKVTFAAQ
jgi:hypothetical protein